MIMTRIDALKILKEMKDIIFCAGCGTMQEMWYEGDLICSKFDEDVEKMSWEEARKKHDREHQGIGTWSDYGKWMFLMKYFEISEEEIKDEN